MTGSPLDIKIKIAKDGDTVRSLGAWVGNKMRDLTPWEIIIDKIRKKLDLWSRTHPTIHGKRLIIQAVVGGHTQFLTKAQGMPAHIKDVLQGIIRDFIWEEGTTPRIVLEYLYHPMDKGGLNLLNI